MLPGIGKSPAKVRVGRESDKVLKAPQFWRRGRICQSPEARVRFPICRDLPCEFLVPFMGMGRRFEFNPLDLQDINFLK